MLALIWLLVSRNSSSPDGSFVLAIPERQLPSQLANAQVPHGANQKLEIHFMLKKTIVLLLLSSLAGVVALNAEPAPNSKKQTSRNKKKETVSAIVPAKPLPEGWSLVNGVWMHSDGYKFVQGQIIRTGAQTHKRPPKPPTQAQIDAATKKNIRRAPTAAEIAAAKAAERERNLRPRPASQTGSHL